jgi:hypothetical protein
MKKITALFFLLILIIGITMAYALIPSMKYPIGDFFTSARVSLGNVFGSASDAFMTVPYWPAILGIAAFAVGYGMGHYNQVSWIRHKLWGHRETMKEVYPSGPPIYQPPQAVPPQSTPTEPPKEQTA